MMSGVGLDGARPANDEGSMRLSMPRSYGNCIAAVEGPARRFAGLLTLALLAALGSPASAQTAAPPASGAIKVVALGDSLTAGLGLPAAAAFPARLQKALQAKGIETEMVNAGVSGDTTSGGRDRLDWSVAQGTDAVILELGANDALRGIDPKVTRAALSDML